MPIKLPEEPMYAEREIVVGKHKFFPSNKEKDFQLHFGHEKGPEDLKVIQEFIKKNVEHLNHTEYKNLVECAVKNTQDCCDNKSEGHRDLVSFMHLMLNQ